MDKIIIGIDPGRKGAIAILNSKTGLQSVDLIPLTNLFGVPEVDYDAVYLLLDHQNFLNENIVRADNSVSIKKDYKIEIYIEDLTNIPKSWQSLKHDYKRLSCLLLDIYQSNQIFHVKPRTWRKYVEYYAHLPKGTTKQRSIKCAEAIFAPDKLNLLRKKQGKIDHNKADAALIAYYGLNK